jgi:hypothetical protein
VEAKSFITYFKITIVFTTRSFRPVGRTAIDGNTIHFAVIPTRITDSFENVNATVERMFFYE